MKHFFTSVLALLGCLLLSTPVRANEQIVLLNEGSWQGDNGKITYFENGHIVSNQWFRDINGSKLGDTPNDIIQVNGNLLAIAVSSSNIIQFIDTKGHAVGATEDIPNNRELATDGKYVYATSFGHECMTADGMKTFTKGFVAKIDITTFTVVQTVEVGWEPEGIALYQGKLFVANTGSYGFQENHDYESTVSIIDAATMTVERNVDTGRINLYGKMSQSGQYLCINSSGDYYTIGASAIIFDCSAALAGKPDNECFVALDYAANYSTTTLEGDFYVVGSQYSYTTGQNVFNYLTINPAKVMASSGHEGVGQSFPGTVLADIKAMTYLSCIYVNPYSGYIYATDSGAFTEGGALYQWSPQGQLLGKFATYINPGHILALDPDPASGISPITVAAPEQDASAPMFNLQGIRVYNPVPGQIYIQNGRKILFR